MPSKRHVTRSAFKDINVEQVVKSRRYSSEPHDLIAAWAKQRPQRVFIRVSLGMELGRIKMIVKNPKALAMRREAEEDWNR